jgi:signal transduction histidine kinase
VGLRNRHAGGNAACDRDHVPAPNVLVVEDDTALSELVGGLLSQAGYNPITIADHAHIGAAVARWRPHCVILDGEVRSTGASRSWDDAAAIRRAHPSLPVVMFTADSAALAEADANMSTRSRAASFAGIVGKPFVVEEFLATVQSAVDGAWSNDSLAPMAADGASAEAIIVFPDVGHIAVDWPDTDLIGMVVHELRAPLTVIRGQVQLARRHAGGNIAKERLALDTAIAQTDRMAAMLTELLDHARLSSNGLSLTVIAFDLADAVADAIARHDYETTPRISFERHPGNVRVRGDVGRIAQILDNLLNNAVKYSEPGDPIEVSLLVEGDLARVRIADHGVGVPVGERGMLFTPFYRTTRTRDVPGTGLGLHISRRLAERHGGELTLDDTSGPGSAFVLTLPVAT